MSHFMVRWLKLSLVVVVGCGFLSMMIYALINRDEIRSSQVEPPLIVPPSEPLKRRPDQPGGMQIPNRDKLVFDLLDSSNTALGDTGVASGVPVSATPVVLPVAEVVSDTGAELEADDSAEDVTPTVPVSVTPKPVVAVTPVQVTKPVEPKVIAKEELKKEEPKKVERPVEAKPVAGNGKWGVQLAAVNSVADGNALAAKAVKEFPVLTTLSHKVTAVPKVKKFRVQFFGAKDREAAAAVCAKLAGKQACFPVAP